MNNPRIFIHAAAARIEDLLDAGARHGRVLGAAAYLTPAGTGVYGSVEIAFQKDSADGPVTPWKDTVGLWGAQILPSENVGQPERLQRPGTETPPEPRAERMLSSMTVGVAGVQVEDVTSRERPAPCGGDS